ncbi:MAG: hypothetical protein PHG73_05500 [Pygmaiobacter sp.]|nr:hypothetical protein [Pygmaiobacter sp.]
MKTIKTIAALGFILLLATQPGDIALWGVMLAACVGAYMAAERSENDEPNRKRTAKKHT